MKVLRRGKFVATTEKLMNLSDDSVEDAILLVPRGPDNDESEERAINIKKMIVSLREETDLLSKLAYILLEAFCFFNCTKMPFDVIYDLSVNLSIFDHLRASRQQAIALLIARGLIRSEGNGSSIESAVQTATADVMRDTVDSGIDRFVVVLKAILLSLEKGRLSESMHDCRIVYSAATTCEVLEIKELYANIVLSKVTTCSRNDPDPSEELVSTEKEFLAKAIDSFIAMFGTEGIQTIRLNALLNKTNRFWEGKTKLGRLENIVESLLKYTLVLPSDHSDRVELEDWATNDRLTYDLCPYDNKDLMRFLTETVEPKLGTEHTFTLHVREKLAWRCFGCKGYNDMAKQEYAKLYKHYAKSLGEHNKRTQKTKLSLAVCLQRENNVSECKRLLRELDQIVTDSFIKQDIRRHFNFDICEEANWTAANQKHP